jgi:tetratricopeptide (TPR) repeat protein
LFAAVSLRPEHRGYWIDGARMLAFDVPQWRGGGLRERRWGVEEALRFLERAEDAHPEASDIPLEVGWLRGWELGDFEGAQRALERAARLAPRIGPAARLRARALERLGRLEEARAWLTEMETVPPQSLREGFEVPAAAVEPRRGRVP